MNYYDLCGINIKTVFNFNHFLLHTANKHDFEILLDKNLPVEEIVVESKLLCRRFVIGETTPFKEVFRVNETCYHLRWFGSYSFFIDCNRKQVIANHEMDERFSTIFFSKILSFLLYVNGYSQLHGSAVRYRDQTICFIGEPGVGKSSCASLATSHGGKIITDDIIAIDPKNNTIQAGVPSLRIDASSPLVPIAKRRVQEVESLRVSISDDLYYGDTSDAQYIFFLALDDQKELSYSHLNGNTTMMHFMQNVYGEYFLKHVFPNQLYVQNPLVFSRLSTQVTMYKIHRNSRTHSEELFRLVDSLITPKKVI